MAALLGFGALGVKRESDAPVVDLSDGLVTRFPDWVELSTATEVDTRTLAVPATNPPPHGVKFWIKPNG